MPAYGLLSGDDRRLKSGVRGTGVTSQALARHRDNEDGLDIGTARILHTTYIGTLSTTAVPTGQRPKLASLLNRGLIHENTTGEGARFRLTQPVLTAISPTAPSTDCRERRGRS